MLSGIELVESTEEFWKLLETRDRICEARQFVRFADSFLACPPKHAIPFEDAQHFTEDTALALARACREQGYTTGVIIPFDDERLNCFRVQFDASVFQRLADIDVVWNYFLMLEDGNRMAVLCDELFNTIAGPLGFIEDALDQTIEDARATFLNTFVGESGFPDWEKREILSLVQYYDRKRGRTSF